MLELFEPEHLENIMVATGQLHRPCLMSYQKNLVLATCLKKFPQIPNFKQKNSKFPRWSGDFFLINWDVGSVARIGRSFCKKDLRPQWWIYFYHSSGLEFKTPNTSNHKSFLIHKCGCQTHQVIGEWPIFFSNLNVKHCKSRFFFHSHVAYVSTILIYLLRKFKTKVLNL